MLSDLGTLEVALALAALVIGATGTFSPCGLSMIETIAPTGNSGRLAVTLAACVTFFPGAVLGGALTFGALSLLGALVIGAAEPLAYGAAAIVALTAAVADARGLPIFPQVRRQLPEHWRRLMPMPLAAGLYGVLLGLGFTTFVLSFGVWALAGIAVAVGETSLGILIGVCFGIGRALPIVVLAPLATTGRGARVMDLLTLRPAVYRGVRAGDAVALLGVSAALLGADLAGAGANTRVEVKAGADPALVGADLAYQRPDRSSVLFRDGVAMELEGRQPALSGRHVAVWRGGAIRLLDRETLTELGQFPAKRVDAIALSRRWVVYRVRRNGDDRMFGRRIEDGGSGFGARSVIARARGASQLGRPAVQGDAVFYAVAKPRENKLLRRDLSGAGKQTLLRSDRSAISNPAVHRGRLVYVQTTRGSQRLRIRGQGGTDMGSTLYRRGVNRATFWSTALDSERAYLTLLKRSGALRIVSVSR